MPAYHITHTEARRPDILIEDPDLTLTLTGRWAHLSDRDGIAYAIPLEQVASIVRVDQEQEPTPAEE